MKPFLISCLLILCQYSNGQLAAFPEMGQLPVNAFPICATDTFRQLIVPPGNGGKTNIPGCGELELLNPYYYSFTCYASGKMGILITPVSDGQDYNWELFDITGRDPNDIFTNSTLAVIGNWSGTYGKTGARNGGLPFTQCPSRAADNDSTFSEMPDVVQGHRYLLVITSYSSTQSGYVLSFVGTTAIMSDPATPQLTSAFSGCDKKKLTVAINKKMRCYSLSPDGSDFSINGNPVLITGAYGLHCDSQFDFDTVELTLSAELPDANYTLSSKTGSDGNTNMDDCFTLILSGNSIPFSVISTDTVSADFNYQIQNGCKADTIIFRYATMNPVNDWSWLINESEASPAFEPTLVRLTDEPFEIKHIVSNGACSDTSTQIITTGIFLKAGFDSPSEICPKTPVSFKDNSKGPVVSWHWDFGDGSFSDQHEPGDHVFPESPGKENYLASLTVQNDRGCTDTAYRSISKLQSCSIQVPNAFTPNGDEKNDFLYPLNAFNVSELEFRVFNRLGQLVFETRDRSRKWDGTIKGVQQPFGTYVWMLSYTDRSTGRKFFLRGNAVLIR